MATYLIDFENVKSEGIRGVAQLDENDRVIIFYSQNADTITFEAMDMLISSAASIKKFKILRVGKNALDFQLSTYLGYLIHEEKDKYFYIISKDNGFQHVVEFWKRIFGYKGYIYCQATVADAYAKQVRFKNATEKERENAIKEDLETMSRMLQEEEEGEAQAAAAEVEVQEEAQTEAAEAEVQEEAQEEAQEAAAEVEVQEEAQTEAAEEVQEEAQTEAAEEVQEEAQAAAEEVPQEEVQVEQEEHIDQSDIPDAELPVIESADAHEAVIDIEATKKDTSEADVQTEHKEHQQGRRPGRRRKPQQKNHRFDNNGSKEEHKEQHNEEHKEQHKVSEKNNKDTEPNGNAADVKNEKNAPVKRGRRPKNNKSQASEF